MSRFVFASAAAALCLTAAPAAMAQAPAACLERSALLSHLARNYQEAPVAVGIADNGTLLEVFVSTHGETWTVAATLPNGMTCMIATGEMWQQLPREAVRFEQPT